MLNFTLIRVVLSVRLMISIKSEVYFIGFRVGHLRFFRGRGREIFVKISFIPIRVLLTVKLTILAKDVAFILYDLEWATSQVLKTTGFVISVGGGSRFWRVDCGGFLIWSGFSARRVVSNSKARIYYEAIQIRF